VNALLGALFLPPLSLVWLGLAAGLLAWKGHRLAGLLAALTSAAVLILATPLSAGWLIASLEPDQATLRAPPGAIIILGGDVAHGRYQGGAQGGRQTGVHDHAGVTDVGTLTLERLRAGAALHRATGLPILVTGGVLGSGQPALASLMAQSLREDFGVAARWIEPRARDTRENAVFSGDMLRGDGVPAALLVTQSWHMPRAQEAFRRAGYVVQAAPVRLASPPEIGPSGLLPQTGHLLESWFAIHEWAGRAYYRWRDGAPPAALSADFTAATLAAHEPS